MRRGSIIPAIRALQPPPYFYDGIHLDFRYGAGALGCYVKAAGAAPTIAPLTTLFTFTGGNQSMYMGPAGLLVQSVTNTPRIEYDASGNCLGLLMEAARTNLVTQSQTMENASWAKSEVTVTNNADTAPDGTTTADKVVESTANAGHLLQNGATSFTSGTTYTFSVYVKAAGRNIVGIFGGALAFGTATGAYFDLTTGAVGTLSNSPTSTSSTNMGNGWFRLSFTKTATATSTAGFNIYPCQTDGSLTYTGDGSSGILVWGAQIEAGAFPSSYIPTTTASVARTADSCIRTLGSEFSATAGTVVVAGRASGGQDGVVQRVYALHDGTDNERTHLARPASTDIARYSVQDGAVNQATLDAGSFTNSTAFKHAAAWAANDFAACFNGGSVSTDTGGTVPTTPTLEFGLASTQQMNGHIRRFDYWPSRLPNTFLTSV